MIRAICYHCFAGRPDVRRCVCPICFSAVRVLDAPVRPDVFEEMSMDDRADLRLKRMETTR